ncbi:hypothetical protein HMPREF9441_02968 [Paraprevotella clara YIT 11840]|uniref:Uncharacterized protein n=1 Tax=Paraprevotella clara YIT 11840 TaxID=762968 RepID=G5SUB1_9BACT|nr:hypothetical protein HMPREF9441_02968 [Paraprevotella clara YIT 11840]
MPYIVFYFRVTLKFWQKYDFFFRIGRISIKNCLDIELLIPENRSPQNEKSISGERFLAFRRKIAISILLYYNIL